MEALEIADQLIDARTLNAEPKFVKAVSLMRLAILLRAKRENQAAENSLLESNEILHQLTEAFPANAEYGFALAQNYSIPQRNKADEIDALENAKEIMVLLVDLSLIHI